MPERMHASTQAVVSELAAPSVVELGEIKAAMRAFRPALSELSQQVAVLEGLVSDAHSDETILAVHQKFTGIERRISGVQDAHKRAMQFVASLRDGLAGLREEMRSLKAEVERVNGLSAADFANEEVVR